MKKVFFTEKFFAPVSNLISAKLLIRFWELVFEGQNSYDIIGTNQAPYALLSRPNKWNLPIPGIEINLTKDFILKNPINRAFKKLLL